MPLTLVNAVPSQAPITGHEAHFSLAAPPQTDLYASPALGYHFSAPIAYTQLPTSRFASLQVSVAVPFTLPLFQPPLHARDAAEAVEAAEAARNPTLQFDQGGIVFVLPHASHPNPSATEPGSSGASPTPHPRWVKAGIEVYEGRPYGSVVVRDRWSDWSLYDLPDYSLGGPTRESIAAALTLRADRNGDALVISVVDIDGEKRPVREVPYWFLHDEVEDSCWVGVIGARPDPTKEAKRDLEVRFKGLEIRDAQGNSLI